MAKIKMQKSTADHRLSKDAARMVKRGRRPLTDAEKEPAAMFIRVAGIRTAKVVKLLKALRHCANKDVYAYNDAQVEKVFTLIRNTLARTERVFEEAKHPSSNGKARTISKLDNPLA